MLTHKIKFSFFSTILFCIFFAMSYPAVAYQLNNTLQLYDGFYLGGQLGFSFARVVEHDIILDIDNIVDEMYPISTSGLVGGGFIGYGKNVFDNYYLGFEVLGNASNARGNYYYNLIPIADTSERNFVSQSVAIKSTWGIDVVPGYKIANIALLYGRVGIKWASLSSTSEFNIVKDNVSTATSLPHRSTIKPGFNFGFGIELAVAKQLSVRGELTHTTYQSYNATAANKNFSYKFYDNQAMAALIYHFA